jgi:hypothetical protein
MGATLGCSAEAGGYTRLIVKLARNMNMETIQNQGKPDD